MEKETLFHCQICGRAIKAKLGLIAHHGYKRPFEGWQTASCDGARYEPYEESCDRLREVIVDMKTFIASQEKALAEFLETPPLTITVFERVSVWIDPEKVTYEKPEEFDKNYYYSIPRTYGDAYTTQKYKFERTIKAAKLDLERMEKRLRAWKPVMVEKG